MQRIVAGLKKEKDGQRIPSIVFTKNGGLWLEKIAPSGAMTPVGLTGPSTSAKRVDALATRWHCRQPRPERPVAASRKSLPPTRAVLDSFGASDTGMSSTWAMALHHAT